MRTTHMDAEMSMLADRHYSRRTPGARQFLNNGRKLVLRNADGSVLFGWIFPDPAMRMDDQTGYNCAIFRNESPRLSSEIILEAEAMAFEKWGTDRMYTYVHPGKIASPNPGYCFKKAGWKNVRGIDGEIRISAAGAHLLAKELPGTPPITFLAF